MKELRSQGITATSGVRLPLSLQRRRNVVNSVGRYATKKTTEDDVRAAEYPVSVVGGEPPDVSSLTLLIFSWMHRRKVAVAQAADSTKGRGH